MKLSDIMNEKAGKFKNIEIEVIHNDGIRIIPKNGY